MLAVPWPSAAATAEESPPDSPDWFAINHWDRRAGVPPGAINALLQTGDGYMWVATRAGVARFDGFRFTVFDDRDPEQIPENEVKALVEGNDGSLWIATYGGGVSRLQNGRFTVFRQKDGLASDFVVGLCKDRDGAIWFATDGGLSRYHRGRFDNHRAAQGVPGPTQYCYSDADGTLWVAVRNGGLLQSVRTGAGLRFVDHTLEEVPAGLNFWSMLQTPDGRSGSPATRVCSGSRTAPSNDSTPPTGWRAGGRPACTSTARATSGWSPTTACTS